MYIQHADPCRRAAASRLHLAGLRGIGDPQWMQRSRRRDTPGDVTLRRYTGVDRVPLS